MPQGLLVHGSNHFIVRGPLPDRNASRRLIRLWEIPQLAQAAAAPPGLPWEIVTKAFREDLEWVVVLENGEPHSAAVDQLLTELAARGLPIHRTTGPWLAPNGVDWPGDRFPELIAANETVTIREMTQSDSHVIETMLGDPDVMLYFGKLFSHPQVREWVDRHIGLYAQDRCAYWLVYDTASGEVAGQAGILRQQIEGKTEFGLGYIFRKEWWNRGLATAASRACLDYAFDVLKLERVVVTIRPENRPSLRVVERLLLPYERTVQYGGFEHQLYVATPDARHYREVR
ncbi:MAG: GNAT family N-acetyltransferase [Bryobacterales bacterium]|nr:GNAT family N-acetyltransferase [Bryobacterales bacterium]